VEQLFAGHWERRDTKDHPRPEEIKRVVVGEHCEARGHGVAIIMKSGEVRLFDMDTTELMRR
jgi:hypothetical protein